MKQPVLYSFRRCPYAMRARLALYHAGIQCELRDIVLKAKPVAMLRISPKGTVPVLQLTDGSVIDESLDIMIWALAEDDAWMQTDREAMLALIEENDEEFKYHLDRYKYPQRFVAAGDAEGTEIDAMQHFHAACLFLAKLEEMLEQAPYLFGDRICMADAAIFPFVRQFVAVDRARFESLPFKHLQRWLNAWLADSDFQQMMVKREPWQAGDKASLLFKQMG